MSHSEEVSYSIDFENEDSSKPSCSQSYSSVAESSRIKTADGDGEGGDSKNNGGPTGESAADGSGNGSGQDREGMSEDLEASDIIVPLSGRSNRSDAISVDEGYHVFKDLLSSSYPDFHRSINFQDYLNQSIHLSPQKNSKARIWTQNMLNFFNTKSNSSQQFSNAIERYEASLLKNEDSGPKSSATELSDISEIMRQLDDMEKTRGHLENYLGQGTAAAASLKTIEELELDSLTSASKSGAVSSRKSEASEIDEIDEIIKKLERLEKAQTALESAISNTEVESAQSVFSTTQRPPASNPVTSKSTSRLVALNSLQQQISRGVCEFPVYPAVQSPVPQSPPRPPSQPSGRQQIEIDTADEMSTLSELNSARNQAPNDAMKPPRPPSSSGSSARSREKEQESIAKKRDEGFTQRQKQSSEASSSRSQQETSKTQTGNFEKTNQKSSLEAQRSERAPADSAQRQEDTEEKLKNEITRQDTLISAYQKEIEHLYKQLSAEKSKLDTKEKKHADEVNQLKTEIATMKVSHLMPVLPSSPRLGQKGEVERLREELKVKSNQMMGLRQEVATLKIAMKNAQAEIESARQNTESGISDDKEKEYQKSIRALEKQVRTLQKLAFHKETPAPSQPQRTETSQPLLTKRFGSRPDLSNRAVSSAGTQTPGTADEEVGSKRQCSILEQRIGELESELTKADSDAREKVQEFQIRLNSLTGKYEARINDLERKLSEAEDKQVNASDLILKLDKAHGEIVNLKLEVARYKRENDLLAKTSKATQSTSKKDANTLSLALKSFKAELAEKEKELVRLKKEMAELKKTNTSLKKERERYLLSTNPNFPSYTRTKSDLESPKKNRGILSKQATSFEDLENTSVRGSKIKVPNYTLEFLQSTLEEERREFENILKEKNNLIEKKEKEIKELEYKLDKLDIPVNRRDSLEEKNLLLEELRTRIQAQNKVIETLKNHLSSYNGIEGELRTLRQEKGHLEFRIRELNQKLVLAKTLNKPEHEILGELMDKVESLSSRYFYREKQIDLLLNRLSTKSLTSTQIPDLDSFGLYSGVPGSSRLGLDEPVSPPLDIHLADI